MTDQLIKISRKARDAAKSLAVNYHAFCVADAADEYLGMVVWGEGILHAQAVIGVPLVQVDRAQRRIALAREKLAEAEANLRTAS